MFIELTENLRCPQPHPEVHLVLAAYDMIGRDVKRGVLGCPECRREYEIENGVAVMGGRAAARPHDPNPERFDPSAVHALLGLASPGGFVALIGSAVTLANELAERIGGVHFVGVDAPADTEASPVLSLLECPDAIPVRTSMMRGVVVGMEFAGDPWTSEANRIVLPGLRVVVLAESPVAVMEQLAVGRGMWVGQKRRA